MGSFRVNKGGISAMVHGQEGTRDLTRRGDAVVALAKIYAPVRFGRLRSSIARGRPRKTGPTSAAVRVSANVKYAAAIHEGRGSRYAPRSWRRRGPGPRRFLTNALSAAGGDVRRR